MRSTQTRTVLTLGTAQTLAWGSTYYLPAILAKPMADDLGTSTGMVFGAFSAALVVAALLGPVVGRRIDARGGRGILSASNLVFAVGLLLLGAAQGPATLWGAWLVIGAGMAMGLYEAAFSALTVLYRLKARSAITGITLLAGLASTICWPISAFLEAELGWRMACFVWAAAHLLLGLPLNRLLLAKASTAPAAPRPEANAPEPSQAPARSSTPMILLAFVFAVTWFISTAMAAHLPRLLQEAGATPTAAIAVASLVGPFQVAGRLLEFGVLRRFHPLLSARLAALAHPVGALALLFFGAPAAMLFAILHGAGNGILTIAKGTLPLSLFGPDGYGFRQGLLMVPARFAQAAAPFSFALLIDHYGSWAFIASLALGLTGFAALLVLAPTSRVEHA